MERIVHVLACLAEGLGIRATARVFEVDPNTVLQWLVEGAEQLHAFTSYFMCEVHVHQVQLDELYAVLSAVKEEQMSTEEAIQRLSRSPQWVWTAIDPQSKLLLAIAIGSRTPAMAQRIIHISGRLPISPGVGTRSPGGSAFASSSAATPADHFGLLGGTGIERDGAWHVADCRACLDERCL